MLSKINKIKESLETKELSLPKMIVITKHTINPKYRVCEFTTNIVWNNPQDYQREYVKDKLTELAHKQFDEISDREQCIFVANFPPDPIIINQIGALTKKRFLVREYHNLHPTLNDFTNTVTIDKHFETIHRDHLTLISNCVQFYESFKISYETNLTATIEEKLCPGVYVGHSLIRNIEMLSSAREVTFRNKDTFSIVPRTCLPPTKKHALIIRRQPISEKGTENKKHVSQQNIGGKTTSTGDTTKAQNRRRSTNNRGLLRGKTNTHLDHVVVLKNVDYVTWGSIKNNKPVVMAMNREEFVNKHKKNRNYLLLHNNPRHNTGEKYANRLNELKIHLKQQLTLLEIRDYLLEIKQDDVIWKAKKTFLWGVIKMVQSMSK
jgi:hypothetical protein